MKLLKNISLLALLFSFNIMAVEEAEAQKPQAEAAAQAETPKATTDAVAPVEPEKPQAEATASADAEKPCPVKEAMKKMKNMYWSIFLTTAGVDDATIEKVKASMEEMMKEEHVKYKELSKSFKAEALKRLTDAGLSPEKAAELMATFNEKVKKPLREAIKAAMMSFVKDRMPGALEVPKVDAAEPTTTEKPEADQTTPKEPDAPAPNQPAGEKPAMEPKTDAAPAQ